MVRLSLCGLVIFGALTSIVRVSAAPAGTIASAHAADTRWKLAAAYYPSGTRILAAPGVSNADVQDFAGGLHASSYSALGRINHHGWLQVGTLSVVTGSGTHRVQHVLSWSYAVSYYRTAKTAQHAIADLHLKMQPLPDVGPYGRVARFSDAAGYHEMVSTLGHDTTVIEMVCTVRRSDMRKFGQLLGQYCGEQRLALSHLTTSGAVAPTPTSGATATPLPATPPPAATASNQLSSPAISFYTQGSHDTCALSGQTSTFSTTSPEMYVRAIFSTWKGTHQIVYEWYAPDGTLFFNTTYSGTDLGSAVLCAWMTIANTDAANLPGTWTLRLRIDGQESASTSFILVDDRTPTPVQP